MDRIEQILCNDKYIECMKIIYMNEQSRKYCKHDIEHSLSVARIAYIISLERKFDLEKELIYASALLHDIGRSCEQKNHHIISSELSKKILYECDFQDNEIRIICDAIESHRNDISGETISALLYKADKLSRNCFWCDVCKECNWSDNKKNKTKKD